jgi:hypothetical protein
MEPTSIVAALVAGVIAKAFQALRLRHESRAAEADARLTNADAIELLRDRLRFEMSLEGVEGTIAVDETAPTGAQVSRTESADIELARIERSLRAQPKIERPDSWWSSNAAPILVGVMVFVGTIFSTVWSTLAKDDPKPDCVAYASMLGDLSTAHPKAKAAVLFGEAGLHFGDLQRECGDPSSFFDGLHS